jgi:hypothetical protein
MVEGAGNIFFDINDKNFTITLSTGIEEHLLSNNINLYPNPANDKIHCVVNTDKAGTCKISLHDVTGRLVKEVAQEKNNSLLDVTMDVSDIASGLYFVRFEMPEGIAEKKFVKE